MTATTYSLRHYLGILFTAAVLLAGQVQAAAPFVDNNDGTVTDTSTGLIWDQCSLGQTQGANTCTGLPALYDWVGAQTQAATLQSGGNYKGYSDWRVPSFNELKTLVKTGVHPRIDSSVFPNTGAYMYWSTTSFVLVPSFGASVAFGLPDGNPPFKTNIYYVRLVRSGQAFGSFGLTRAALSGITPGSATLTATSPVAATGYWMVVPRAAAAPLATEIIAGVASYRGVSVAASGNAAMAATTPQTFAISGLGVGTNYDLYLVAKTSYSTVSDVLDPLAFASAAITTSSIVVNPVTPSTLFAGQDSGGVYKSLDSGATWAALNTGLSNLSVKALAIQADASRLFAGTDGAGVFFGDGSSNWMACGALPGGAANINSLTLSGSTLYAGTTAGVFASTDGCTSWAAMNTGLPN
ncbi:DUF1566 domain-containing protein [Rhodoferax sp.]|uniref:Lcl C-terminal domain-containing protein n=1 Tax=Rhodoferax sp. TaxID=50421 RepID=UPI00261E1F9A|nr:DUF1566 domain-containing protein [Rhodoferax sp.]MDD2923634.1 DUF1566 domain-containing protein [Rhodoferax sp.]